MSLLATSVGTLLDVDQEACEFLKRDRDSLLGGNFSVILTSPYRGLSDWPVLLPVVEVEKGDGSVCPVELSIRPVTRQCTPCFLVTLRPVMPVLASMVMQPSGHVVESKDTEPVMTLLSVSKSVETVTFDFERLETSDVALFMLDLQGVVRDCSRYVTPWVTGYARNELLERSINIVVPSLFPLVPMGVCFSCEGVHKDGHVLFLAVIVTCVSGGDYCCQMRRYTMPWPDEMPRVLSESEELGKVTAGALLGSGAFSSVRLGLVDGCLCAIKLIEQRCAKDALKEVEILKSLDYRAIPKVHAVMQTETHVAVAMEFCPGIELGHYIRSRGGSLLEQECKHYFRQLCSAVSYIHSKGIVHRDIKLENVLVQPCGLDKDWRRNDVKLIDFGLSMQVQPGVMQTVFCGTRAYAAPEVLAMKPYHGPEIDVWSLGIVLYAMLVGRLPFPSVIAVLEMPFPSDTIKNICCANLLSNILQKDPSARFTVAHIQAHSWLDIVTNTRFIKCRVLKESDRAAESVVSESTEHAESRKRSRSPSGEGNSAVNGASEKSTKTGLPSL